MAMDVMAVSIRVVVTFNSSLFLDETVKFMLSGDWLRSSYGCRVTYASDSLHDIYHL